ncbi:MAG: hypothetical protein ABEH78_07060 [Haloferacaceae archaeon]
MTVEEDCPICNSSQSAKEQFATAKVAEHIKEKAGHNQAHRDWIDSYTTNGTLSEIREALAEHGRPR